MLLEHIKDQATQISQEVIKEENKKEHQVSFKDGIVDE